MSESLRIVLTSVFQVFGLVGLAYLYFRRRHPDLRGMLQIGMQIFIPCLAFTAILDSKISPATLGVAAAGSLIQIGTGLILGWPALRLLRQREKRELLLPVAFVNASFLAFPLVLANFGPDGLSIGVVCYAVMTLTIFTVGVFWLHGGGRMNQAWREPAVWAAALAAGLRLLRVHPPDLVLAIPRLAAPAAVPVMLVLFGETLSRTRLTVLRPALVAVFLRYATGAVALGLTLIVLRPQGLLRQVLILYALLPPAITNVMLTQKAGRDAEAVASAVLLGTLASVVILPLLLAALR